MQNAIQQQQQQQPQQQASSSEAQHTSFVLIAMEIQSAFTMLKLSPHNPRLFERVEALVECGNCCGLC